MGHWSDRLATCIYRLTSFEMHENARPAENMPAEGDIRGCDLLVAVEAHRADHGISGADRDDDLLDAVPLLPAGPVEVLQLAV